MYEAHSLRLALHEPRKINKKSINLNASNIYKTTKKEFKKCSNFEPVVIRSKGETASQQKKTDRISTYKYELHLLCKMRLEEQIISRKGENLYIM